MICKVNDRGVEQQPPPPPNRALFSNMPEGEPGLLDAICIQSSAVYVRSFVFTTLAIPCPPDSNVFVVSTHDSPCDAKATPNEEVSVRLLRDVVAFLNQQPSTEGTPREVRLRRAWERFFCLYDPVARRIATGGPVPHGEIEDCLQEVWIDIVRRLRRHEYDPRRGTFPGWLTTVIRHRVIDYARANAKRPTKHSLNLDTLIPCQELDPAAAHERQEKRQMVAQALDDLRRQTSSLNYQLLHLRLVEGCGVSEVATRLGLTSQQVWYRQCRVKKKLRRLLEYRFPSSGRTNTGQIRELDRLPSQDI